MGLSKVSLDDVVFDGSIYPRDKPNTSTIEHYADVVKSGKTFPPIVLEEGTNRLLDGYHRWKAYLLYREKYKEWQEQIAKEGTGSHDSWTHPVQEIDVEFHKIPGDIPPKLYCAKLSSLHGDRLTATERKNIAREIYEQNPDFTLEIVAEFLAVSPSTAGKYTADIRARRKEEQRVVALRLDLLGWTEQEIADRLGVARPNVKRDFLYQIPESEIDTKNPANADNPWVQLKKLLADGHPHIKVAERMNLPPILVWALDLKGKTDEVRMERLDIKIQPYDVWQFSTCHDLFGADYPGRIPGQLVAHVLYFFTEPGDLVVDPMAGSGTTLDVCLAMGRKCYGYDIDNDNRYKRPDIIKHNIATDGWPGAPREGETNDKRGRPKGAIQKADLIFWDPPYFSKMDSGQIGEEGYCADSISKLPREQYMQFFANSLTQAYNLAKPGCKLAFLMSDWDDPDQQGLFIWDYVDVMFGAGWTPFRHIQVPLSTQQVHPDIVNRFRKDRRLARLERYLILCRKEKK